MGSSNNRRQFSKHYKVHKCLSSSNRSSNSNSRNKV
jgi:hypothetical protein